MARHSPVSINSKAYSHLVRQYRLEIAVKTTAVVLSSHSQTAGKGNVHSTGRVLSLLRGTEELAKWRISKQTSMRYAWLGW